MSNLSWFGILGCLVSIGCFGTLTIVLGWGFGVILVLINIGIIGAIVEKEKTK